MKITEFIKNQTLYLDGGMGTLLQARGLSAGEMPERWNLTHPDQIVAIHRAYYDAGSHVVNTNTFGAYSLKLSDGELEAIIGAAVENAKRARRQSSSSHEKWIALDIGPTGRMLKPYGDLDFEDAVRVFSKTIKIGAEHGVDLIFIETMSDSYETKAALLAAKECCDLPVFVSNAYGEDGKLMTGASPRAMVAMLEGMGADAIGVNCSFGPETLAPVVEEYLKYASIPVLLKPNAGLPRSVEGKTVYDVSSEKFARDVAALIGRGVRIAGGCCGTTPAYISALSLAADKIKSIPLTEKQDTVISSYTHAVSFGGKPILIGERINPTGKKRLKEALRQGDLDYLLKEGIAQEEKGAEVLDVNVGLPEIDERAVLRKVICELQAICDLPLQIDTADPMAMEAALRRYNGKPMINSVNGKRESMAQVFPLAKKYGGVVVALTLDEEGIPATAEGRLEIARRILSCAESYGIAKKDLIFDPLALTISADPKAALETLRAIEMIRRELDCPVSLGVSNVSFGLPCRDAINSAFFTMAMEKGLSAAIMNPHSIEMMKAYHAFCALSAQDENCASFISFAESLPKVETVTGVSATPKSSDPKGEVGESELQRAIVKGLREEAARQTIEKLSSHDPLELIQKEIIPALNTVGVGFENKTVYLPQLLMSAEAAKASFEVIKERVGTRAADKSTFVLATVKGDIHDIGKNIVKLLLENFGFDVLDLGRDVPPEQIVKTVLKTNAPLVGLSALMTTTVPAMEETIRQLREASPSVKIVVGGAVLTREYADAIGADYYAKDAMATVRYAEDVERQLKNV